MRTKKELGDYQTPLTLIQQILERLEYDGSRWPRVLEPTCGIGNFIEALLQVATPPQEIVGVEIQPAYVMQAVKLTPRAHHRGVRLGILGADVFQLSLPVDIQWQSQGRLLVIGNPPWATNSMLSMLGSSNLPAKSNFKNQRGIDAITGGSNFDIAEFIILKMIAEFIDQDTTIAMLCKTSVARNVLKYSHQNSLPIQSIMYRIDAKKWFGAAVDACLLRMDINKNAGHHDYHMAIYDSLSAPHPSRSTGFVNGLLVSDIEKYQSLAFVDGKSPIQWRSGVKHDSATVLELSFRSEAWYNTLGEKVSVEEEYIYPLIKGTSIYAGNLTGRQGIILTQMRPGEDTDHLKQDAPKLWRYLLKHREVFEKRKSSIYKNKPIFSIFGVGDYSFAPYKILVSALNKKPVFRLAGPINGRPVICDDTSYLLPFDSLADAMFAQAVLNHPLTLSFISSLAFPDSKRVLTSSLLNRIDLRALIDYLPDTRDEIISSLPEQARYQPSVLFDLTQIPDLASQSTTPSSLPPTAAG